MILFLLYLVLKISTTEMSVILRNNHDCGNDVSNILQQVSLFAGWHYLIVNLLFTEQVVPSSAHFFVPGVLSNLPL